MKYYVLGLAVLLPIISAAAAQETANPELVKRGEYLVTIMGCNDCHTPFCDGTERTGIRHDQGAFRSPAGL
jgi:CDGSH-type Zn-finger protein